MSNNGNKKRKNVIINDKIPTKDQLIVDYIKDQLEEKMQESAMDINVFCKDGYVHMSGMVDVLTEKKFAEEIVMKIPGVRKLENKITIAMDSNITDKHMEKEVVDKLHHNSERTLSIGAKVDRGVVNLMGHADTLQDCHKAMDLASGVRGVKDVVNNININSEGKYTDDTISNNILQAYSNSPLDYRDITRRVSNGEVILSGTLDTHQDIELAKEIAMGIEGVVKVRNNIQVRKTDDLNL
ncbi:BON domain-containing protein [Natronincola ferrireducens]|uniref:Osmotically-inducible protein OsmY, contains BON domain n=1 Tax=Natronincola ferrireducens TaxID=393762 RepID=A0A1G9J323_9FIRM|nr:BON domain-containing protein [Natronincola ferrireducens]SDL31574.1 Osmotically-inducible protein OsmY, contains BON domain [Natronincola ferrireducens]